MFRPRPVTFSWEQRAASGDEFVEVLPMYIFTHHTTRILRAAAYSSAVFAIRRRRVPILFIASPHTWGKIFISNATSPLRNEISQMLQDLTAGMVLQNTPAIMTLGVAQMQAIAQHPANLSAHREIVVRVQKAPDFRLYVVIFSSAAVAGALLNGVPEGVLT